MYSSNLENALFELVPQAVRAEVQEISRRSEDRVLTIDQVATDAIGIQGLVYRNSKKFRTNGGAGTARLTSNQRRPARLDGGENSSGSSPNFPVKRAEAERRSTEPDGSL